MSIPMTTFFAEARRGFHESLLNSILRIDSSGVPTNADKHSRMSIAIATEIVRILGSRVTGARLAGQMAGKQFEAICKEYLEAVFNRLNHLRPGSWELRRDTGNDRRLAITSFDQYSHLKALDEAAQANPELAAALGVDYIIKPDVVIMRHPEPDETINAKEPLVDDDIAQLTSLRKRNNNRPILHASISCKWTIRSDRAQNARSEALNLVRNRKGRLPHIVVVTAEPAPNRIASIALGTGDVDCVYHFALPELQEAIKKLGYEDAEEMLNTMINGKRLRDIADLPLDLVI